MSEEDKHESAIETHDRELDAVKLNYCAEEQRLVCI